MALCNLSLNLDLNNNMNVFVNCKQFDTLNINFNIFKSGLAEDLKDYKARLKAFKSDQTTLVQEHTGVTISNNVVTVKASEQLTNVSGNTIIELQFYNKITGEKKSTYNIILTVYESSINVDGSISKSTYTLLEELEYKLDQATDYFESIEKATNLNNDLKLNITQATTLSATLKDNTDKGTTIDNSLKENIPKATEGNTTLLATIETSKTTKTGLDESIKKANDFITANGNISELATKVDQNTKDIAALSNPNLLINGDFQVWQRGTSFNIPSWNTVYTADRWGCGSEKGATVEKTDKGLKITNTVQGVGTNIYQRIEDDTTRKLVGKKVTLTFYTNGATDLCKKMWVAGIEEGKKFYYVDVPFTDKGAKDTFSITVEISKFTKNIEFGFQIDATKVDSFVELVGAKLEIGEKATPLTPLPYGEELELCQRFYQNINLYKQNYFGVGVLNSAGGTSGALRINLSVPLRQYPTIILKGELSIIPSSSVTINALSPDLLSPTICKAGATLSKELPVGVYMVEGKNAEDSLSLDAEIY